MSEMNVGVVGVRELKAQLSEYLRRVKAGETVIITERGRPIGRIVPEPETVEESIKRLIDAGLADWNGEWPEISEPTVVNDSDVLVSDIVVELRE
jgi:prevent-host-death family protein